MTRGQARSTTEHPTLPSSLYPLFCSYESRTLADTGGTAITLYASERPVTRRWGRLQPGRALPRIDWLQRESIPAGSIAASAESRGAETRTREKRMEHNSMKIAAMVGLSALCGCAVLGSEARRAPVERLDERGASAAVLSVEGGTALDFVNADARPHQIYSNDCRELSSPLLNPGETYTARLGTAPKLCHFQDLLAPLSSSYSGTVQVHDGREEWRLE